MPLAPVLETVRRVAEGDLSARARLSELLGARDALLDKLHALQERILAEGASR